MDAISFESVVTAKRGNLLRDLGNASQASEQKSQAQASGYLSETTQNLLSLNTGAGFGGDALRGRNLDVYA